MTRGPRFIAGIYNYCDRWCDRCSYRERCLLFAELQRGRRSGAADRGGVSSLMPAMRTRLGLTLQFLRRILRRGTGADGFSGRPAGEEFPRSASPWDADRITPAGRFEPLVLAGHVYAAMVDSWMDDERPRLPGERGSRLARLQTSPRSIEGSADARALREALDVVLWDRTLIPAKLARAVSGAGGRDAHAASDVKGSAKVALLSMDRSLAAWRTLCSHRGRPADSALPLLVHLERLRGDTEARFPDARSFRRPGFDDGSAAGTRRTGGLLMRGIGRGAS